MKSDLNLSEMQPGLANSQDGLAATPHVVRPLRTHRQLEKSEEGHNRQFEHCRKCTLPTYSVGCLCNASVITVTFPTACFTMFSLRDSNVRECYIFNCYTRGHVPLHCMKFKFSSISNLSLLSAVAPATAPMTLGQSNAASKQSSSSLKLMFIATITAILLAVTQQ